MCPLSLSPPRLASPRVVALCFLSQYCRDHLVHIVPGLTFQLPVPTIYFSPAACQVLASQSLTWLTLASSNVLGSCHERSSRPERSRFGVVTAKRLSQTPAGLRTPPLGTPTTPGFRSGRTEPSKSLMTCSSFSRVIAHLWAAPW